MIVLKNIVKKFGDHTVINRFSLTIEDGEHVAIMGESGVGKTTLLRIIANLEKIDGGSVAGYDDSDVAYVFQEPRLFERLTVLENLTVVADKVNDAIKDKAIGLLSEVGLSNSCDLYPSELSGGMKQRVNLARAFMKDSSILLLDEPFSALDSETREDMIRLVLKRTKGKTVVMVTHSEEDASKVCSKVVRML